MLRFLLPIHRSARGQGGLRCSLRPSCWSITAGGDHTSIAAPAERRHHRDDHDVHRLAAALGAGVFCRRGAQEARDYHGERHTVTVAADGFEWQGTTYGSLSTIARRACPSASSEAEVDYRIFSQIRSFVSPGTNRPSAPVASSFGSAPPTISRRIFSI
jgi:hypothetical protein